ncbi:unnamed protein product [Cylicocyclus nassatus]|uniref:Uncharacterized protein n=1 Tax=Cylicocyclus nassatus TaxID=53992 RepID=A0AA36HBV3_CYLNA|nr:unnamed protein product [Cylicocyclus nassatus]
MAPDHQDVIVEEVLKRRNLLWDRSGNRELNCNHKRTQAWKEIRRIVFEKLHVNEEFQAPPPSESSAEFSGSQEKEFLKQLSTFESDSESDTADEIPRKRSHRSNAQQELLEEQTKYIRAKRMYLEKYAILNKVDALVDRIQINTNVQTSGPPQKQQRTKVDDNIEESLLS